MSIAQPAFDHQLADLDGISESLQALHQTRTQEVLQALQLEAGGRLQRGTATCDARVLDSPGGSDGAPANRYRPTIWVAG